MISRVLLLVVGLLLLMVAAVAINSLRQASHPIVLLIGAIDWRHFARISDPVDRFSPVRTKPQHVARAHGTDERVATVNFAERVRSYHQQLTDASSDAAQTFVSP